MSDIIKSRNKDQKGLMKEFDAVVSDTNRFFAESILSPLTITLGDEFQGIVNSLEEALSIIINIEETLIHKNMSFKLRYVLNEGDIDTPINKNIAYGMLGTGLTYARETLNLMKKNDHRFFVSAKNERLSNILNFSFVIFESIVDRWDYERDYPLVSAFLSSDDYKDVANQLNKNRSLMWKREKSLNIEEYRAIKAIIKSVNLL